MTYGDDRTAGAMGDDERRDYVRQDGAAMAPLPDGPSRDLRERLIKKAGNVREWPEMGLFGMAIAKGAVPSVVDAILAEIAAAGFEIIASDRLKRLQEAAYGIHGYLQPGDLDPGEPGAGR